MKASGPVAYLRGILLSAVLFGGAGCVSEKLEPPHRPKLGVAQNSDGSVVFRLETRLGYKYQIQYEDPVDRMWKPLKGCESISGTGEAIEFKKKFNSRGPLPPFTVTYSEE